MIKLRKIKNKKIKEKPVILEDNYQAKNMFIIIIVIIVLLIPLYFITNLVIKNEKKETVTNNTPVEIQNEKILVGQLLNRSEDEYYVIAYKKDNKMISLFNNYINDYKNKENNLTFYKIDLDDGLNKGYISDTENISDNLKDLKISDTTLFIIKNKQIDSYYVGNNEVLNYLKEING